MLPDPRRLELTACRALAVGCVLYAPMYFGCAALIVYLNGDHAAVERAMEFGTGDDLLPTLALMIPGHVLFWPTAIGLPRTRRFTVNEKWGWGGAILLAGVVALPFAAMAGFWWTLAERIEEGRKAV